MPLHFLRPLPAARRGNSFTLIEIVLAIAVCSIAVVSIFSLFPVGLNTAADSRSETRATYLAQQITSDLRSSAFTNATILYPDPSSGMLTTLTNLNLTVSSTTFLACDSTNNILGTITGGNFTNGVPQPGALYLVELAVTPTTNTNLCTVAVEVSSPAQAALPVRSKYGFETLIANKQ